MAEATVASVERIAQPERVYNLRITPTHNYFAAGVLVHNCDDPHNADEIDSDARRTGVLDWWDSTMSTRGNNPDTVARVIVMQRLHEEDLVGHLLERMKDGGQQYDHLVLPAEYEPTVQVCGVNLQHDQRTEPGQLLSPARFNAEALARLKADLGEEKAAGQLQQRPAPAGGAIFKREWWTEGRNRYDVTAETPAGRVLGRWLFLDTAMKDQERHDYSARTVLELLADYRLRVRDVWRAKLLFPSLVEDIEADARRWNGDGLLRGVVIEDKGSGTSAYQTLKAGADDWLADLLVAFQPQGSKVYRGRQASLWCSRACVLLPHPSGETPWLFDFETELTTFPAAAHDDQVDTLSMGVIYLEHLVAEGWRARGGRQEAA